MDGKAKNEEKSDKELTGREAFIAEWIDENCRRNQKINKYRELHVTNQLEADMLRNLCRNLNKEVDLRVPKKFIRLGDFVQLIPVCVSRKLFKRPIRALPALSITINERVVRFSEKINEDCEVCIALSEKSCIRNTFKIIGAVDDCHADYMKNERLKYGQEFRLQCIETSNGEPHYLYVAQKPSDLMSMVKRKFDTAKNGDVNLPLAICSRSHCGVGKMLPADYCLWKCEHADIKQRHNTKGLVVPSNAALVITHVATKKSLNAGKHEANTIFGPEFKVACQNYNHRFGNIGSRTFWLIYNGEWSVDSIDKIEEIR